MRMLNTIASIELELFSWTYKLQSVQIKIAEPLLKVVQKIVLCIPCFYSRSERSELAERAEPTHFASEASLWWETRSDFVCVSFRPSVS